MTPRPEFALVSASPVAQFGSLGDMSRTILLSLALLLAGCMSKAEEARWYTSEAAARNCPGYATATRAQLGSASDVTDITSAVRAVTHDSTFAPEIRWLSPRDAIVPIRDGCFRLIRSRDGKWKVIDRREWVVF